MDPPHSKFFGTMIAVTGNRPRIAVFVLAFAIALGFQGSRGLYETTEGRYALAALEMLERGEWRTPRLEGRPHLTKPPLTYWGIRTGLRVAGKNPWGARLFNVPAFALTALVVAALAGALTRRRDDALRAGILYATALFPAAVAASLNTDTLLTLWTTLGMLAYVKARNHARTRPVRSRRWMLLLWTAFGLGMLTKGPPALLTLLALLVFHFASPARRRPRWIIPEGLAAFVVLGLGWYIWMAVRTPGLLRYFLVTETFNRMATGEGHHNSEWYKPLTIYGLPLLIGAGIWPLWVRRDAWRRLFDWQRWRRLLRTRRGGAFFLFLWMALPLVILSLSKSRLETYVLPLFPVVILWLTLALRSRQPRAAGWLPQGGMRVVLFSACLILGAKALLAHAPELRVERILAGRLRHRLQQWKLLINHRDMGRLYAACRPWDHPEMRFALADSRRNYGLLFYLNQPYDRLLPTTAGMSPFPDALGFDEYFAAVPDATPHNTLFVVSRRDENEFRQAATAAGHVLSEADALPVWKLYRIRPAP